MSLIDALKNNSEIHVYILKRNKNLPYGKILKMISDHERYTMKEFRFEEDRFLYGQTRYSIRTILGQYLMLNPQKIEFSHNKYGKPKIIDYMNKDLLEFNISHSKDIIVVAISYKLPIGVDVEYINNNVAAELFHDPNIFNIDEIYSLAGLVQPEKLKQFYRLWNYKESHLKRLGIGLSYPLFLTHVSDDFGYVEGPANNYPISIIKPLENLLPYYIGAVAMAQKSSVKYINFDKLHCQ